MGRVAKKRIFSEISAGQRLSQLEIDPCEFFICNSEVEIMSHVVKISQIALEGLRPRGSPGAEGPSISLAEIAPLQYDEEMADMTTVSAEMHSLISTSVLRLDSESSWPKFGYRDKQWNNSRTMKHLSFISFAQHSAIGNRVCPSLFDLSARLMMHLVWCNLVLESTARISLTSKKSQSADTKDQESIVMRRDDGVIDAALA
jgi:hypothetical protein